MEIEIFMKEYKVLIVISCRSLFFMLSDINWGLLLFYLFLFIILRPMV